MNKTAIVTDGDLKTITTDKNLMILTVEQFLKKDCDYDIKNPNTKEYVKVLKSQNLSDFFVRRFSHEGIVEEGTNLGVMTNFQRECILEAVEREYKKAFVEYRDLFRMYTERLLLFSLPKAQREQILASKEKDEYSIHPSDFVRPSVKIDNTPKQPSKATIRIRTKNNKQNNN